MATSDIVSLRSLFFGSNVSSVQLNSVASSVSMTAERAAQTSRPSAPSRCHSCSRADSDLRCRFSRGSSLASELSAGISSGAMENEPTSGTAPA